MREATHGVEEETGPRSSGGTAPGRLALWLLGPAAAILAVSVLPLVVGTRTLFMRDVFSFHLPVKMAQAEGLRQGFLPLVDATRGGGQPLLGNPNVVPFYPDNLLYVLASPIWSLNAHFWIHLLLAPLAMYWLARRFGLSVSGASAAAVFWVFSGFFLSQMNFYNLIGGTALLPAFLAAGLALLEERPGRWSVLQGALLWALLIVAGDPILAAQAGLLLVVLGGLHLWRGRSLAAGPAVGRPRLPAWRPWLRLASVLVAGVVLALPQLVEFLRILKLSYRGYWGYEADVILSASLNPLVIWEWFLPFAFGRPNLGFWGAAAFGDEGAPFFWSLFPGCLALVCLFSGGLGRGRERWGLWALAAIGVFLALGGYNPVVRSLAALPGFSLARYPVKFVLLTAVPCALLAGFGFERLFGASSRRIGYRFALVLAGVYVATAAASLSPDGRLAQWIAETLATGDALRVQQILRNWLAVSVFLVVVLCGGVLAMLVARRSTTVGGALFLTLHAGSQLFLMQPLVQTEATETYAGSPPLAQAVRPGERLLHVGSRALGDPAPGPALPGGEIHWLTRKLWSDLAPVSGVPAGALYELNESPEGLDSFLNHMALLGMRSLDDVERLRVARAFGVDLVLVDRALPLVDGDREVLRERATAVSFGRPLHLYEVLDPVPEFSLQTDVWRAPHLNAALAALVDPAFDPLRAVVLPGDGERQRKSDGTAAATREGPERWRIEVSSPEGGVLMMQRSHQPFYRAFIDGQPAQPVAANLSRPRGRDTGGRARDRPRHRATAAPAVTERECRGSGGAAALRAAPPA